MAAPMVMVTVVMVTVVMGGSTHTHIPNEPKKLALDQPASPALSLHGITMVERFIWNVGLNSGGGSGASTRGTGAQIRARVLLMLMLLLMSMSS